MFILRSNPARREFVINTYSQGIHSVPEPNRKRARAMQPQPLAAGALPRHIQA